MYETRKQAALNQDENKKGEVKATKAVEVQGKAHAAPVNNRRALGDIGNVVVAAPIARNTAKDGHMEPQNLEKKVPLLNVIDRPITRSFVAQLAKKNQVKETTDKSVAGAESEKDSENNVNPKNVLPVGAPSGLPARVKTLQNPRNGRAAAARKGRTLTATLTSRSEAVCGGFKAEHAEEPVTDIDADDVNNQLAVVDYVEDIYSFYSKTEIQSCVPPDYMSKQVDINHKMRAILVDWLMEVHFKFKLMPETLFLTINLIDRYLAIQLVERKNLQLVGMTALLVASKYEEIWAPEVRDLIIISENIYTRQQILDMEKLMLNTLKFNLCIPTPYMFLVRILKAAASDAEMNMLAFYYVELCLVEYEMVKFRPSVLAASAVYLARNTLKSGEGARWNATLKWHSGYKESDLLECANLIVTLHKKATDGAMTVHRKYSEPKYKSVALLSPPAISALTSNEATTAPADIRVEGSYPTKATK